MPIYRSPDRTFHPTQALAKARSIEQGHGGTFEQVELPGSKQELLELLNAEWAANRQASRVPIAQETVSGELATQMIAEGKLTEPGPARDVEAWIDEQPICRQLHIAAYAAEAARDSYGARQ